MTPQEWATITAYLAAAYPHQPIPPETAQVWWPEVCDLPAEQVAAAARRLARTSRYLPTLAELLEVTEQVRREQHAARRALERPSWDAPPGSGTPPPPEFRRLVAQLTRRIKEPA